MPLTSFRPLARPRALLTLCAAMALAVLALLPAPALAHDTLISSDPADGDSLEVSPEAITLTYSANILEVSPVVRVVDEAGETVADIEPAVEGPDVIAALEEPLAAGTYTVQWRVVSSDGHPIEGSFAVTVEQDTVEQESADQEGAEASGAGDAAAPSDGGGEEAAASDAGGQEQAGAAGGESAEPETGGADSEGESSTMPILLGVVGIAVVGVVIAAYFALRKRS